MKNKTRRLAAFLLSAAVVITVVPGMQERVYAQETGGYTESPKSENVPVVKETKSRLKKAAAVPSAYMNKLSELTIRYPGVRDQGKYDTCWAFSAIGLAEFDLIADNQTADKSIDLSELQLAYFTYNNVEDPLGGTFGDSLNIMNHKNYLTIGGNLDFASRTLLQWKGVTDENRVPYALAPTTTTLTKSYAFDQDVAHLQNVYIINIHKNATQVKCEIMQHGSAGLGLYMDGTANYVGSAVYAETGENVATYCCPTSSVASNHAVNIVGWDDNFPASSFKNKPAGDGAWLCRNSWSDKTENNINSYFWLSYYDKSIEDAAWIFDFESADNYDYNYQYDGGADVGKLRGISTSANIFRAKKADNELVKAVSISLSKDANVPYTIRVYTNLTNLHNPKSGILAAKVSGTTTYAGTHTIRLNKAVSVPQGTYYAVVVELQKSGAGLDMEYAVSDSSLTSRVYCDYNQSFLYRGGSWEDVADVSTSYGGRIGNICIKAYADNAGTSIGAVENIKAVRCAKNAVRISWGKTAGAKGYEIYQASSKNGTYKKIAATTSTKYKIKTTSKKSVYYKVRAYKTTQGIRICGNFSGSVAVKR